MTRVYSMTGFGKSSGTGSRGEDVRVEVRTFNSKSLKLTFKLPILFAPHEEEIRARVRAHLKRASGSVTVHFRSPADVPETRINTQVIERYANELAVLKDSLGLTGEVDLSALAGLPGSVEIFDRDRDAAPEEVAFLLEHLEEAMARNAASRLREGAFLARDLEERVRVIQGLVAEIRKRAPAVVEEYRDRLAARIRDLLGKGASLDESILASETALFAERSDIHEECVRALHHLETFLQVLAKGGEIGRRLDFIAQEIHRELNTINSKANDIEISRMAVEAKTQGDKIKEQVQNVE